MTSSERQTKLNLPGSAEQRSVVKVVGEALNLHFEVHHVSSTGLSSGSEATHRHKKVPEGAGRMHAYMYICTRYVPMRVRKFILLILSANQVEDVSPLTTLKIYVNM